MKKIDGSKGLRYQLDPAERTDLIVCARNVLVNTYPISGDGYAVALMTASGSIYEGVSYKSETHTLTMHAEATALANAAIHGETDVVAITGPNCHICKQLIYENSRNSGIDIMIIMDGETGPNDVPISAMMPYAWPLLKAESDESSTQTNGEVYQCSGCKLHYREKSLASQCEAFCIKYKACNMEITKHSVEEIEGEYS